MTLLTEVLFHFMKEPAGEPVGIREGLVTGGEIMPGPIPHSDRNML